MYCTITDLLKRTSKANSRITRIETKVQKDYDDNFTSSKANSRITRIETFTAPGRE